MSGYVSSRKNALRNKGRLRKTFRQCEVDPFVDVDQRRLADRRGELCYKEMWRQTKKENWKRVCALLGALLLRSEPSVSSCDRAEVGREISILQCCEVEKSMTSPRKSSDWDGIIGEMCKAVYLAIASYGQCLHDCSSREGYSAVFWKTARIVVLLKLPEEDNSYPSKW